MMTRGVKTRLVAFVVLSLVGVVYASANYLGLVDAVLGRGYSVTAQLPASGGLYEGSLVTYRGVQIGKVGEMTVAGDGISVRLDLEEEARVPAGSDVFVHNGSAVGEQYLDFEPAADEPPFLAEGDVVEGGPDSLPVDEADLMVGLDEFVGSVDRQNLSTVVGELGDMFSGTGRPLQDIVDSGNTLITEASESQEETIRLLEQGRTVLRTQEENAANIRDFASGLAGVASALRSGDADLRTVLQGGPGTVEQIEALLTGLEPTLPVLLSNLVTVNQVTTLRLDNLEQLLVTYPVIISSGFTGTTTDGYGHVHLEYTQNPPPCTEGYLPPSEWRPGDDLSDGKPYLEAHCGSPPPYAMRGSNYVPRPQGGAARVAPYDPTTGSVMAGRDRVVVGTGPSDVYGEDAWKWMLIGPTVR